jgi:hypothetical protein
MGLLTVMPFDTRKRWPYTPYWAAADFGKRFKYSDVVTVYDLSAVKRPASQNPTI